MNKFTQNQVYSHVCSMTGVGKIIPTRWAWRVFAPLCKKTRHDRDEHIFEGRQHRWSK